MQMKTANKNSETGTEIIQNWNDWITHKKKTQKTSVVVPQDGEMNNVC